MYAAKHSRRQNGTVIDFYPILATQSAVRWDLGVGCVLFIGIGLQILSNVENGLVRLRTGRKIPLDESTKSQFMVATYTIGGVLSILIGLMLGAFFVVPFF